VLLCLAQKIAIPFLDKIINLRAPDCRQPILAMIELVSFHDIFSCPLISPFSFPEFWLSVLLARTEGVERAQAERKEIALFIERDIMD
jgi:hypothetical protein